MKTKKKLIRQRILVNLVIVILLGTPIISATSQQIMQRQCPEKHFSEGQYEQKEFDPKQMDIISSGAPNVDWIKTWGNIAVQNYGMAVREVDDGGYIIIGDCPFIPKSPWLIRTDKHGNKFWGKRPINDTYMTGSDVQQTNDGGFIIVGNRPKIMKRYGNDIYLFKTNETGAEQWHQFYWGPKEDHGVCVEQTTDGGFIIGGQTNSSGSGDYDWLLIKTDENGTMLWNKTYGSNAGNGEANGDVLARVHQTSDNGYIIAGSKRTPDGFSGWVIKTDEYGVELWNRTYEKDISGVWNRGTIKDLQITEDGGFIICAGYDPNEGTNRADIWIIKTDENGTIQWDQHYDHIGYNEYIYSVDLTLDGGYIFCGTTTGDYWYVMKTTADGTVSWDINFGRRQTLKCIRQTRDGGYIITGWTFTHVALGYNRDIALIRLAPPEPIKANTNGYYVGLTEEPIQFHGSATGGVPPYSWYWDFGDGHNSTLQNPTHTYTTPGNHSLLLTVTDQTGLLSGHDDDTTWVWIQETNVPPETPLITGPQRGEAGEFYNYTVQAEDPENAPIFYYIEWGDGRKTGWLGMYKSDTEILLSHYWEERGNYTIRAKAKDIYGNESDWATLEVRMPHNNFLKHPFLLFLEQIRQRLYRFQK